MKSKHHDQSRYPLADYQRSCSLVAALHTDICLYPPLPAEDDYFVGGDCEDGPEDDDGPSGHLANGDGAGDSSEPMETGQFDDPEE